MLPALNLRRRLAARRHGSRATGILKRNQFRLILGGSIAAITALSLLSDRRSPNPAPFAPVIAHADTKPPTDTPDPETFKPNETGTVPILMYHNIEGSSIHAMMYPVATFRNDLQWLYDHDYRPISLSRFARGYIDCPAGKSPVILTFDDGDRSQLNYLKDGTIDPNCAVAIMDDFHAKHPDWLTRATFFVIAQSPVPFQQPKWIRSKLQFLVKQGYEIGNHTVHHPEMNKLSDLEAESEIAGCVTAIHRYLPGYVVNTLALPYGLFPRDSRLVVCGGIHGQSYHNICAMAAGWRPAASPISKSFHPFDLDRIQAGDRPYESHWWLNYLEAHKSMKFVSDGNPAVFTVTRVAQAKVDASHVKLLGFKVQLYGPSVAVEPKYGHKHLTIVKSTGYTKPQN